jgi:hypothetical protein
MILLRKVASHRWEELLKASGRMIWVVSVIYAQGYFGHSGYAAKVHLLGSKCYIGERL